MRKGFGSRPAPLAPLSSSTTSGGPSSSIAQPSNGVPTETGSSGTVTSNAAIGSPTVQTSGSGTTNPPGLGGQEGASGTATGAEAAQGSSTPTNLTNSHSGGNRLDNSLARTVIAMLGLFAFLSS